MKVRIPGHSYELENVEDKREFYGQTLNFIHKQQKDGGEPGELRDR